MSFTTDTDCLELGECRTFAITTYNVLQEVKTEQVMEVDVNGRIFLNFEHVQNSGGYVVVHSFISSCPNQNPQKVEERSSSRHIVGIPRSQVSVDP